MHRIRMLYITRHVEYDIKTGEGGLFATFINKFLKIKQEASGYPSNCVTENAKDEYVRDYFTNEGVLLDKSKIAYNEGLRAIAKLILNSFWGRYGMKENKSLYKLITKTREWFTLISVD